MDSWDEVSFLELEMYVIQKHHVTIVPSFSSNEVLHMLTGKFGPFKGNQ